jgi:prepilin-type N-terminal cleavage/methylation domain-containing protein
MGGKGFTLIEIMVVIAIIGILSATAVPAYNVYRQRSTGAEASVLARQLLEHNVMYYMENEEYFPPPGDVLEVYSDGTTKRNGAASATVIQDIKNALNVDIPVRHNLDFILQTDAAGTFWIQIDAPFAIFKTIPNDQLNASMDNGGKINYF